MGHVHLRSSARIRAQGHTVTAVDIEAAPGIEAKVDRFVLADLDDGLPADLDAEYQLVVAADVLEHVRDPARLLGDVRAHLAPNGRVLVSVPNFGHWYPRTRTAIGAFDYDRRGILDAGHVRFFTRRSFLRLVADAGFEVVRSDATPLPLEVAERGGDSAQVGTLRRSIGRFDNAMVRLWPTMFAYQFLFELAPRRPAADRYTGETVLEPPS